jgi:hypothetical protein
MAATTPRTQRKEPGPLDDQELVEHIRRLVDTFPPLGSDQRNVIAASFRGARRRGTTTSQR